ASNATPGAIVTIPGFVLPVDGMYRVDVRASSSNPASTGNYVVSVNEARVDVSPLLVNQQYNGTLGTAYDVDRWTFSVTAGQQIRFDLIAAANPSIEFTLTGPDGYVGFRGLTAGSDLLTLPSSGTYTLSADANGGITGSYAFRMLETSEIDLPT